MSVQSLADLYLLSSAFINLAHSLKTANIVLYEVFLRWVIFFKQHFLSRDLGSFYTFTQFSIQPFLFDI